MELVILLKVQDRIYNRNRIQDGSGVAPEGTLTPAIRIGVAKGIAHNPHAHVFLLKMMMP